MSEINRPKFECQIELRMSEIWVSDEWQKCRSSNVRKILRMSDLFFRSNFHSDIIYVHLCQPCTASPQICHGSSPSQGNDTHTSRDTIMSEIMCHTIYFKWQKYVWSLVRMSDLQSDTPSMYTSHGVSYCVYCVCHVYVMTELPRLLRMSDLLCYLSSNVRFSFLRCLPNYVTWGTSTYSTYSTLLNWHAPS